MATRAGRPRPPRRPGPRRISLGCWETDEEPGGGAGPRQPARAGSLQGPLGLCVHTSAAHSQLPGQGLRQDPRNEFLSAEAASGSWRECPQAVPVSGTRAADSAAPHGRAL